MKTDFANLQANLAAHYTRLAQIPGWRQYARHRVEAMAKETPELWADLPRLVREALAALPAPSSSPTASGPSATTPHA